MPMMNPSTIQITREIAQKVLNTIDAGLKTGLGMPIPGQMCVEAAVCYALGLPHDDDPGCVLESLRRLKIRLNDSDWSSPRARANGLRRLALAQLGSKDVLDGQELVARVVRMAIIKHVSAALRAAASTHTDPRHQIALNAAAGKCESEGNRSSCIQARDAARAAAYVATNVANCAASAAANAADFASMGLAEHAAEYAADAAAYATEAGNELHAARAASNSARDKSLAEFAEDVVQILIQMKAPGCQWLDLTEVQKDWRGFEGRA
jgi:hypothetical protein